MPWRTAKKIVRQKWSLFERPEDILEPHFTAVFFKRQDNTDTQAVPAKGNNDPHAPGKDIAGEYLRNGIGKCGPGR